jgi:D-galactarolactone cycloisomerase
MKIKNIRTYQLSCQLARPFSFSQWSYRSRHAMMVEIVADDGASGWGECYGPAAVCQSAVADFYAPRLLGRDPLETEVLWHHLWQSSLDFARGGVMTAAISGLDMALWDLKGQVLKRPLSALLGGRSRDVVPCYATGTYFQDAPEDKLREMLVEEAGSYRSEGFKAIKIKVGKNVPFDLALARRMREALPGVTLMADANHAYDLPEALRVGTVLSECGYAWFEEPLSPEHPEQYRQLHDKLAVPLAAGECEQTRYGFRRLLSAGGVDIAQPDLAYCGGISEALKIRTLASSLGVNVVPHVWGTMFNLAAAVHFLAATFVEPGRLEAPSPLLERDRTPHPLRDELFEVPVEITGGSARVPGGPGLGVKVNRSALKKYLVKETDNS